MKKKTIDILTTFMAVALFLFGFAAFWVEKFDWIALVGISVVSIFLILFKNDGLKKLVYGIFKVTPFLLLFFLVSCNPCKYVAKHPECFPADTVRLTEKIIHYEKEIVTNDSIVYEETPCDPETNTVYEKEIQYRTKTKTITDTIYTSKEVAKINPVNDKLKKKTERQKMIIYLLLGVSLLAIIIIILKR